MRADVVVMGLGTAGAAAAWQCARRGMTVVALDARPLDGCGARWVNGVAGWQLDEAQIPQPQGAELVSGAGTFHLVAGYGPDRIAVEGHGVLDLDMRLLVERLQNMASGAGTNLLDCTRVTEVAKQPRRHGRIVRTERGESIHADFVINAAGLSGAGLSGAPRVPSKHICAAAQAVHRLTDSSEARTFFDSHGVSEGEVLCFTGIAGGYSILNLRWHADTIHLLTGSIPGDGFESGRAILDRFVQEKDWIGAEVFGGARAIPLRRPATRLANAGVALAGDAAGQVFSAHGSGIGLGLIASRLIGESLEDTNGLRSYEVQFQRRFGGLLAAYDLFRRFSQRLSLDDVRALIRTGMLDGPMSAAGMAQRWPSLDARDALNKLRRAGARPDLAIRMGNVLPRMAALGGLYRVYPRSQGKRLRAWSKAVSGIFGEPADPVRLH